MNRYPDMAVTALSQALAEAAGRRRSSTSRPAPAASACSASSSRRPATRATRSSTRGARSRPTRSSSRSPARRRCRCRWTPTPGTTSTRCWPRSPSGPGWCSSAPPTTRPGRWCTSDELDAFLDRVPAGRAGRPRRGLPRVRHRPRRARRARDCTGSGPTSRCCGPSPRRTGWPACGWATPSRTSRSPQALRKTAVPFGVSDIAQQAAVASLEAYDELQERVDALVAERARVVAALREQGWAVPQTRGQLRVAAAGRTTRWPSPRTRTRPGSSCGRSPATGCAAPSPRPRPTTCSSPWRAGSGRAAAAERAERVRRRIGAGD